MYMSGPIRLYKRHMLVDNVAICLNTVTKLIVVARQTFYVLYFGLPFYFCIVHILTVNMNCTF